MEQITEGARVRLAAYGGEEIVRRVVDIQQDVIMVCKEEEFERAKAEGRRPVAVGFQHQYVLGAAD